MNRKIVIGWSGGLLTAALLAACGSPATGGASVPAGNISPAATSSATASGASRSTVAPCSLVTEPEATAFLGIDPGPGVVGSSGSAVASCGYAGYMVIAVDPGGRPAFDGYRSVSKGGVAGADFQDVNGTGDAAFVYSAAAGSTGGVCILKGSLAVLITVLPFQPGTVTTAKSTALAMTVAGRF
jgi:hypothetical protein